MRKTMWLVAILPLLTTAPTQAAVPTEPLPTPTIFTVRLNGVTPPPVEYAGPLNLGAPDLLASSSAPEPIPTAEEGGNVMLSTMSNYLGRMYDRALSRLPLDLPVLNAGAVSPNADPGSFRAAGIKADTVLPILGLKSVVDMSVSTEGMRQSVGVSNGCGVKLLPNSVTSDVIRSFGDDATRNVQGSWGTACASGQAGWRLTAGVTGVGTPEHTPQIGMEYRPQAGSMIADLTGLSAMKAQVAETGGSVGVEAPFPLPILNRLKLNADMSWHDNGSTAWKLGTKLRF